MSGNTFGRIFTLTTFGESHGPGLGGVVDGCPPGLALDEARLQKELDARKPGQSNAPAATSRAEDDRVRILSGVFEGKTTGAPIAFFIENTSQRSADYEHLRHVFRPGHADYSWQQKFGLRDHRGGGRSSARETVARVAAGAIALVFLESEGIELKACTVEFGGIAVPDQNPNLMWLAALNNAFFGPHEETLLRWLQKVEEARAEGETLGGIVQVAARGVPPGLGEPVFDGLDARLAAAMLSVGAVKGVEFGAGFEAARKKGSGNNDLLTLQGFLSNNAGGVLGGVSSGQDIVLKAAIKPIPSLGKTQPMLTAQGEVKDICIGGRHDLSPIPRIVPVLKSMAALALADFVLLQRTRAY